MEKRTYNKTSKNPPGRKPGPFPGMWKTGKDPKKHEYYQVYMQHRNQANYREETYELSFEQFLKLWGDKIEQRGRKTGQYSLSRIDKTLPWNIGNTIVKCKVKNENSKTKSTENING